MKKDEAIEAGIRVEETKHNMKRRKPWHNYQRKEETKHNMKRRKPWHNYQRKGTYMLTLVVDGRQPLLGKLVMPTNNQSAYVELTELGKIIYNEETQKIPYFYKMVEVWKVCIMPDHIHMIVRVKEDMPDGKHLGDVVRGFKVGCTRAWWRLSAIPAGETAGVVETGGTAGVVETGGTAGVVETGETAGVVETRGTTGVAKTTTPAVSPAGLNRPLLFESGYNDQILLEDGQLDNWLHYLDDNPRRLAIKRILLEDGQLDNWLHYLDDNPRRLAIKRQHPDYFTTMHYTDIAEWHCQLVGNSFLLNIPDKVAVIVHSAYSDEEFADYKQKWLACGERGGVLVSAAIATREKEVMREAMNRGYRLILARENGFPPLYKPAGESFNACSQGLLLQVSPWEYHMQRRTISREQCLKLNRLVETITQL